jgi:hypothetical protein
MSGPSAVIASAAKQSRDRFATLAMTAECVSICRTFRSKEDSMAKGNNARKKETKKPKKDAKGK